MNHFSCNWKLIQREMLNHNLTIITILLTASSIGESKPFFKLPGSWVFNNINFAKEVCSK